MGTSKHDCRGKIRRSNLCFRFLGPNVQQETTTAVLFNKQKQSNNTFIYIHLKMKWFCSSLLCYNNFCSKTGARDKIKYYRLAKNPKTQNEY